MTTRRIGPPALAFIVALAATAHAQLAPPMVRSSKPIGAGPGETITLEVRATDVRDGASIRFDDPAVRVEAIDPGKGEGARTLKARVAIPAGAVGPLGFRVMSGGGVSNPGRVLVGRAIPSVAEAEPNDRLRRPQAIPVPAAVEGALSNGDDVDVFAVEMEAGGTLVAEAIAERAGSRLDAWVTILGPDGRELAADDDLFGRDAAAWAAVPAPGRYLVAIQDANGKHRDGATEGKMTRPYRLEIGRFPLVAAHSPGGARRGQGTALRLLGANLPGGPSPRFDPPADAPLGDRFVALGGSNPLTLRVGDSPESEAAEAGDDPQSAAVVAVPAAINGLLERAGDVDDFRLRAAPGAEGDYSIRVLPSGAGSPAVPVLGILDARGEPRGEGDEGPRRDVRAERVDAGEGLLVSVRDYFGRGGGRFGYRVEVERVVRGVAVAAELGHRTLPRGGALAVPVTVERRGFEGPVTVLAGELPAGVLARPLTIARGESLGLLVFSAAPEAAPGAFPLRLAARDAPGPATFACRERGPIDEVPRENEQAKGPRETVVDAPSPVLAVAEPAPFALVAPAEAVAVKPGGRAEVKFALAWRPGAARKPVKARLLAPGKALDGFEPAKEIDLKADAESATFALQAKPGAAPRSALLAAHAWAEGSPDLLGVDSGAVELVVTDPK